MQIIKVILQNNRQNLKISEQKLLAQSPKRLLERTKQSNDYLNQRLFSAMKTFLKDKRTLFQQQVQTLEDISPLKVLGRGYIYTSNQAGETVMSVKNIAKDEVLNLHFADGNAEAKILEVEDNENAK